MTSKVKAAREYEEAKATAHAAYLAAVNPKTDPEDVIDAAWRVYLEVERAAWERMRATPTEGRCYLLSGAGITGI